jgi:membrane protein implicated in regulation of membrane protease activity
MDITPLTHGLLAVVLQVITAGCCWRWFGGQALTVGAIAGSMVYFGRELTQHELKIARSQHISVVDSFPQGIYLWNWSLDGLLDLAAPILFTTAVVLIYRRLKRPGGASL